MSKSNGKSQPLTAEDLRSLKPLSYGDMYYGHKHADRLADGSDDPQDFMAHAVHHAAVEAGYAERHDVENGEDSCGFLNRFAIDVMTAVFKDDLTEPEGDLAETPTGS